MKKLKNNKGITGVDIVVSISLIVIVLGIVMSVYTLYSNKSKEVKRTSIATNLAMKVIEKIDGMDITEIEDNLSIQNSNTSSKEKYGLDNDNINGYNIQIKKITPSDTLLQNVAFQVDVTVSFEVQKEEKKVTLSTVKKDNDIGEAEAPTITRIINESGNIQYKIPNNIEVVPVKKNDAKGGYVKADSKDSDWYSISSKVFPIVVILRTNQTFDRNGIIHLVDCEKIYVWMPSYGKNGTKYSFCDTNGKIIKYLKDSETNIGTYQVTNNSVTDKVDGQWVEVYGNLESENSNYQTLKNAIFTWE